MHGKISAIVFAVGAAVLVYRHYIGRSRLKRLSEGKNPTPPELIETTRVAAKSMSIGVFLSLAWGLHFLFFVESELVLQILVGIILFFLCGFLTIMLIARGKRGSLGFRSDFLIWEIGGAKIKIPWREIKEYQLADFNHTPVLRIILRNGLSTEALTGINFETERSKKVFQDIGNMHLKSHGCHLMFALATYDKPADSIVFSFDKRLKEAAAN